MSSRDRESWQADEAKSRAIARGLGEGWILRDNSPHPDEWRDWHLRRVADGLELDLTYPDKYDREKAAKRGEAGRLVISLCYPIDKQGQRKIPTRTEEQRVTRISVDERKPPEQVARAICWRLLPQVEPLHRRAVEMVREADAYQDETTATLLKIIGTIPGAYQSVNGTKTIYFKEDNHAYGCEVQGDSVRFQAFSVPADVAIAILQACRKGA